MSDLYRFDFYIKDWMIDTQRLTLEERGVLIQVIAAIYQYDGYIDNDSGWLANLCNCSVRKIKTILQTLVEKEYLSLIDGKITQKRALEEIENAHKRREKSVQNARKKAEKDAKSDRKTLENAPKTQRKVAENAPKVARKHAENEPESNKNNDLTSANKQSTNNKQEKKEIEKEKKEKQKKADPNTEKILLPTDPIPPDKLETDFADLWAHWLPFEMSKGSKSSARKSYQKARKDTDHATLIQNAQAYCSTCHGRQSKTKHLASWLNQRGWEDDIEPITSPGAQYSTASTGNTADDQLRARISTTEWMLDNHVF